ncbi:hybrid sensor histidine kinase/response regulator transcription factor [Xylanibacter brevis]|uniref:hybrid sensor histidine kinase/response regulator transcription factor n=1 Tax=Xylanibacter brevis TaxID=83231 RepID=UPI000481FDDA|nr:ATP-binding protein [Xylanibacter brevis]
MNLRRLYLILYMGGLLLHNVLAQPINVNRFSTSTGLSTNATLCALRDSYGLLWIGTENGLNYFDGMRVHVYRDMFIKQNPNETNTIISIFEHEKNIWLGGTAGLYVLDRQQNKYNRFEKKTRYGVVISTAVPKMINTDNGLIWIATQGQGLFIYDSKKDSLYQDSRHGTFFCDIEMDSDGLIYAATFSGELAIYRSDGQFLRSHKVEGYKDDKNPISMTRCNGHLWLGFNNTLKQLSLHHENAGQQWQLSQVGGIRHLTSDASGHILTACENGLFRFYPESGHLEPINANNTPGYLLNSDNINHLVWDADSSLMVLTETEGINILPTQNHGIRMLELPLATQQHRQININALCMGEGNEVWIASDHELFRLNTSTRVVSTYSHAQLPQEISSIMLDGKNLWIGTRHQGIRVIDTQSGAVRNFTFSSSVPYTIPSNEINKIFRAKNGDIYILSSWGLSHYNRQNDHFRSYASISAMTPFVAIAETDKGWLWASSANKGLYRKDPKNEWFDFFQSNAIGFQAANVIHCDSQGVLWLATNGGGLYRMLPDAKDFERYDVDGSAIHGLAITFIEEDKLGNLWMGSTAGIVRITPSRDLRDIQLYATIQNQEANVSCNPNCGYMLFGTTNGLFSFVPQQLKPVLDLEHVYIQSINFPYIDNDQEELRRLGLDVLLYTKESITLPYSDNSFTLHFASSRFCGMPPAKYEYMLEGFDKTWVRGTSNSEATYANLPPGDYEFLLRRMGDNNDQEIARLKITILPPWYRTTLAYIFYLLLIAGFIYHTFMRTQRRLKRRYARQMESFRTEQEKQTFQSKIRFFVDLVHEIRTPLTLISLPLEKMQEKIDGGEALGGSELKEHLSSIRRNMNYLLGITNQLLDFQKAENGGISLMQQNVDIKKMLTDIYKQFFDAVKVQGKQIQLQLPEEGVTTVIDLDKMKKVMMNIVGNALKYTNREIILKLEVSNDEKIKISVIDDGSGVPTEERDKIFDRYYQIGNDNIASSLGTGLGLAYAKMLAEAHHGDLQYEDAPGGGSCFIITLPLVSSDEPSVDTEDIAPVAEEAKEAAAAPTAKKHTILLVEDNEELLKATADSLRQWYKVVKAHDGVEALDILNYSEIDIIVSDLMMPRMDGIELCQNVKTNINTSHLPLILLTAKTTVESKVEGMESGADIYMEKPFAIKQLHLQIENLLRLRQQFYERMKSIEGFNSSSLQDDSPLGLNQQDIQFVERLQKSVADNMRDEEFSIDTLAEQLNMSRSSFYRKIKALTGMTPTDYLKTSRMNQAALLLREGCRSSEVAERVGFSSTSYFAKCFKAQFGILPKEFS